ncbi:type II toxin-antitoxin system HicA family toxin [Helicobacter felis]|uniref:type II toxin-antitoxin system HicA family toxin n=1 Tax=Helicobacter felis TaxID=214 RepID=UPI000EF7067F|nr:toxin-antitoxin system, toxin component, HicA family protein [Helicobacter felis]
MLTNGFIFSRQKGSHRISKGKIRQVLAFHSGQILHPKILTYSPITKVRGF